MLGKTMANTYCSNELVFVNEPVPCLGNIPFRKPFSLSMSTVYLVLAAQNSNPLFTEDSPSLSIITNENSADI